MLPACLLNRKAGIAWLALLPAHRTHSSKLACCRLFPEDASFPLDPPTREAGADAGSEDDSDDALQSLRAAVGLAGQGPGGGAGSNRVGG
jgi:hypothetical protein